MDIDQLSYVELCKLQEQVAEKASRRREEEIDAVIGQVASLLTGSVFTADELMPRLLEKLSDAGHYKPPEAARTSRPRKPRNPAPPYYYNPDNPGQTASATGRRPRWFNDAKKKYGEKAMRIENRPD